MPLDHVVRLQNHILYWMQGRSHINVLEAGCGSSCLLSFSPQAVLFGIDISESQLKQNSLLTQKVLGDIQVDHFKPESFDAIVCWDVLEHLPNPRLAIDNFINSINREGIVVLKAPNVFSFKGLLTKYLPYRSHLFIGKYLYRTSAQRFKTYLRFSIAPSAIVKYSMERGLKIIYFDTYDMLTSDWFAKKKAAYRFYKFLRTLVEYISFGKLGDSEFIIILQKP